MTTKAREDIARMTRPSTCPGSGQRVTPTGSSAFPEVQCSRCDATLRPVLDDKALNRYRMRSHQPKGKIRPDWRERV